MLPERLDMFAPFIIKDGIFLFRRIIVPSTMIGSGPNKVLE